MLENIWEFLRKEILVPECHLFAVCIKMMDFENPNSLEPGLFHAEACILHREPDMSDVPLMYPPFTPRCAIRGHGEIPHLLKKSQIVLKKYPTCLNLLVFTQLQLQGAAASRVSSGAQAQGENQLEAIRERLSFGYHHRVVWDFYGFLTFGEVEVEAV